MGDGIFELAILGSTEIDLQCIGNSRSFSIKYFE